MTTMTHELIGIDHDKIFDALRQFYDDPKHPDDMFNLGVADMYDNLTREQQLQVLQAVQL